MAFEISSANLEAVNGPPEVRKCCYENLSVTFLHKHSTALPLSLARGAQGGFEETRRHNENCRVASIGCCERTVRTRRLFCSRGDVRKEPHADAGPEIVARVVHRII